MGPLRCLSGADYILEAWRLRRFCKSDVEDELYAFIMCDVSPDLVNARSIFRSDIDIIDPNLRLLSDLCLTFMLL